MERLLLRMLSQKITLLTFLLRQPLPLSLHVLCLLFMANLISFNLRGGIVLV